MEATKIAQLTGLNRNSVNFYLRHFRHERPGRNLLRSGRLCVLPQTAQSLALGGLLPAVGTHHAQKSPPEQLVGLNAFMALAFCHCEEIGHATDRADSTATLQNPKAPAAKHSSAPVSTMRQTRLGKATPAAPRFDFSNIPEWSVLGVRFLTVLFSNA
jgi:hypothetical protein